MKTAFALFLVLLSVSLQAYTPPDSCLKLIWPNNRDDLNNTGTSNPDSVKVDSCVGSPTYGRLFANRYFECKFTTYIFDSVIQKNEIKTVNDISTSYPNIKSQFLHLDSIYCPIYFIRDMYDVDEPDSAYFITGFIYLFFNDYPNIDTIEIGFNSIIDSLLRIHFVNRAVNPLSVPSDVALKPSSSLNDIYLYYKDNGFYPVNWEPFGFQSNIYQVNCPLAWEITTGSDNTVIAISGD